MGFHDNKTLEEEEESERLNTELDIAQKRALIQKAKKEYGSDWKRIFTKGKGKGFMSGIDWEAVKFRYR